MAIASKYPCSYPINAGSPCQTRLSCLTWRGAWHGRPFKSENRRSTGRGCTIVIPVYRGRRETLACIDSVLATAAAHARIVVIDDATDDGELVLALDALAAAGSIELHRNDSNQGFVRSVNAGLALYPAGDAVILNSDTIVHGDWLARLRAAAYSSPKIGTVTPWSNSGSIASYPSAAGQAMGAEEAESGMSSPPRCMRARAPTFPSGWAFAFTCAVTA